MSGGAGRLRIAVTAGEPAGIGPDLLVRLAQVDHDFELIAVADPEVLTERAHACKLPLRIHPFDESAARAPAVGAPALTVLPVTAPAPVVPGRLTVENARHVLAMLDLACDGCREGRFAAMVTAPLHKGVINDAGIAFTGHTEYLAQRCGTAMPVMMLAAPGLRVALATTHLPLAKVAAAITIPMLEQVITILERELRHRFQFEQPRITVCGLNPHAGEGGHLGREEVEVIGPVVEALRAQGMRLRGPVSADTAFNPEMRAATDAYLAMYHDQGLPVLKALGFGEAVNVTLGLPIIRTSVDHGTALELAGTGRAAAGSLAAALAMAARMAAGPPVLAGR
jgi:4-hydroxythreonine-4-phosphate dehydrogenase